VSEKQKYDEFDRLIRDRFGKDSVNPPDDLWNSINDNLEDPNSGRRRRGIFYWISSVLLIAILIFFGIGFLYWESNETPNSKPIQFTKQHEPENEIKGNSPMAKESLFGSNTVSLPPSNPNENNTQNSAYREAVGLKMEQSNDDTSIQKIVTGLIPDTKQTTTRGNSNLSNDATRKISNKSSATKMVVTNVTPNNNSTDTLKGVNAPKRDENEANVENLTSSNHNEEIEPAEAPSEGIDAEKVNSNNVDPIPILDNELQSALDVTKSKRRFSIMILLQPEYTDRLLSTSAGSSINKDTESGSLNLGFGITGRYDVSEHIQISSGLCFQRHTQHFQNTLNILADTLENKWEFETSFGTYELEYDDDIEESEAEEENVTLTINSSDQFSYIRIPVSFQYLWGGNKLHYNVSVGLSYNYLIHRKQIVQIEGNSNFQSSKVISSAPTKSSILQGTIGFGLEYDLSSHLSLAVVPSMRLSLYSLSNTGIFPYSLGLKTGLIYRF